MNQIYTYNFKIPVNFRNLPVNKKPVMQLPEFIQVEVKASGLKLALILLNESKHEFEIDFNKLKSSNRDQNFVLSGSQINLGRRFKFETQIKSISPDTLYFTEKTGFQKLVPVKAPLYIRCREGYGYKRPVITPPYLTIWGDTNLIEKIDTLYTQALTLNNLSQNLNTRLQLIKQSPDVHCTVNEVNLSIEVARLVQQTVTIPVFSQHELQDKQIRMFPSRVRVTFTSVQNSFNQEDTVHFKAMINPDKVQSGSHKCPVFLGTLPGNITVLEIEPREVEILIFK